MGPLKCLNNNANAAAVIVDLFGYQKQSSFAV